ncbi:MAG: hypothetical protein QF437_21970, partial [Planctomycetota bacterium]|nr:hypothetical protein [Planctomycetota bacterium]
DAFGSSLFPQCPEIDGIVVERLTLCQEIGNRGKRRGSSTLTPSSEDGASPTKLAWWPVKDVADVLSVLPLSDLLHNRAREAWAFT